MKYVLILVSLAIYTASNMEKFFTFSSLAKIKEWRVVNDDVMGGVSKSSLTLTADAHGQFSGQVSLENYGGFASIQLNKTVKLDQDREFIVLRIKGDGKKYEFRLKNSASKPESYVHPFNTSGQWEEVKLPISEFYPQYRGRKLNTSNFNFQVIEQCSFLIANKQQGNFQLVIDWIGLE
jgi:hypothetical protein